MVFPKLRASFLSQYDSPIDIWVRCAALGWRQAARAAGVDRHETTR